MRNFAHRSSRILILSLTVLLCAALLAACGGDPSSSSSGSSTSSSSQSYPEPENPLPVDDSIAKLYADAFAANPDVVGWLQIPDSDPNTMYVNFPILQSEDNDYYMTHDALGNESEGEDSTGWYGAVYAHHNNDLSNVDKLMRNTVLFGHNKAAPANNGQVYKPYNRNIFASLLYFQDEAYAQDHRYITMTLGNDTTYWLIFAAVDVANDEARDSSSDFYYWNTKDQSDEDFLNMLEQARERSYWDYEVEVKPDDKILTLSTCNYSYDSPTESTNSSKFILMARMLRPDELAQGSDYLTKLPTFKANDDRHTPEQAGLTHIYSVTEFLVEDIRPEGQKRYDFPYEQYKEQDEYSGAYAPNRGEAPPEAQEKE